MPHEDRAAGELQDAEVCDLRDLRGIRSKMPRHPLLRHPKAAGHNLLEVTLAQ